MAWPWRLPAWAAAAAVVVVIGAALFSLRPRGFVGDTLRESPSGRPQSVEVRVRGARVEEDRIVLEWEALPGADAYRVLVLGPDLSERSRFGPFNGTSASLPEGVMTGSGAGRMLVWQVVAMRGGDPIARSPVETLSGER